MLDIALIRRAPERVRRSAQRRGLDPSFVDELLLLDSQYRKALTDIETAKSQKNALSAEIGRAADKAAAAKEARPHLDALAEQIAKAQTDLAQRSPETQDSRFRELLTQTPNVLDDAVPEGRDERSNVLVREWGKPREFSFAPKPHWELGETLGILDFERAANLSGCLFYTSDAAD